MVRNTASAGTVAGTGLIRTPSGERGATHSGDELKSSLRLNVGWKSLAGQPIPWSAVDPYLRSIPPIQVKQQDELGRAFNGYLADHHRFLFAHMFGRIDSIDADIGRHRRADRRASGRFSCRMRSWTPGSSSPRSWVQRHYRVQTTARRRRASEHRDTCVCPPLPKDHDHDEDI